MKIEASRKNIPNYITSLRIIGTVCLSFLEPFSIVFYVVYTLTGISDAIDGWLARKLKMTSEYGAKMDSIADLLFYTTVFIKIFPTLRVKLPVEIWIFIGVILCLRLCSYGVAAWKYNCLASLHTYMNKLTGLSIFLILYAVMLPVFVQLCMVVCIIAVIATVEELLIHIHSKKYHTNVKSIREV